MALQLPSPVQFHSVEEVLGYLKVSRATFFRLKKEGKVCLEKVKRGENWVYILYNTNSDLSVVHKIKEKAMYQHSLNGEHAGKGDQNQTDTDHSQYVDAWIRWREEGLHVRPWSKNYKRGQLIYLNKYFERWKTISSESLEEWLLEVPAIQRSKRVGMHAPISSMAKFLHYKGLISTEEYTKIRMLYPKKSPYYEPEQKIIYEEDLEVILEKASKNHHRYQRALNVTLIQFLSETGLRVTEACELTFDDLIFSDDPKKARISAFGKGGKRRIVPFSKKAQEVVRDYMENHRPKDLPFKEVFISFNPKHGYRPMDRRQVADRFQRISEQCGIPFTAHSFRHYRITQWANNPRIPITVTQKWAGHSSLVVTQRYVHIRDEDALAAAFG